MAPFTGLLYCYRLPHLDAKQFKDYIEETHAPLVKSLLGPKHPLSHTRYYPNKDMGYMLGTPTQDEPDLIAVLTFESAEAAQESVAARQEKGIKELIEADEEKFMDRSKVKFIVIGDGDFGESKRD